VACVGQKLDTCVAPPLEHERVVLRDVHVAGAVDDEHRCVDVLVEQRTERQRVHHRAELSPKSGRGR
jgi:hypothetical protein